MPLWLERFFIEYPWAVWSPIVICVGGAGALWWRQSRKARAAAHGKSSPVRVGWFGAAATILVIVASIAVAGHLLGLWADVWVFVNERPALVAWWMAAAGAAVMVWGVAVHAWRAESRLARQCRKCRYDMTGVPGLMTCPECGRVARSEKQLRPVNVRRGAMWAGGLIVLLAVLTPAVLATARRGPVAALPTRALVWWLARTSAPPQQVFDELALRMQSEPASVHEQAASYTDGLAARWLESDGSNPDLYQDLLEQQEIPPARQEDARRALADPSAAKRANAARLLAAATNPIELSEEAVVALAKDRSRPVAVLAESLWYSRAAWAAQRLNGQVKNAPALDAESARRYLRVLTATSAPLQTAVTPAFRAYTNHADREVALRAACVVGVHQYWDREPDVGAIVAMMRAKEELDVMSGGPGPAWASLGWYCLTGWARWDFCRPLIQHPDPAVRLLAFRQMLPSKTIPQGARWGASINIWRSLLDDLQAQFDKETDAEAKAALSRLIAEIMTEKPAVPAK